MGNGTSRIYIHYRIFEEDDLWVGECVELGVSTCAETEDEVRKRIAEATQLYVDTLEEHGELSRVLQERGVRLSSDGEIPRDEVERKSVAVRAGTS